MKLLNRLKNSLKNGSFPERGIGYGGSVTFMATGFGPAF
jgi:hypothetical protein